MGRSGLGTVISRLDRYLLAILATVAVATVLPATGGAATAVGIIAQGAVALLFFLYGARLSPRAAWDGLRSWRLHLAVLGSTEQSSIAFTAIARGNVAAAICSASFSNLAGVVVTPVLAALFLGSRVDVSPLSILSIAAQLVLPFLLGQWARRWIGGFLERHSHRVGLVDRGSVLLVVYSAFSAGVVAGVWHQVTVLTLLVVVAVDVAVLAVALTVTAVGARRLGFGVADRIVVVFCGSKKSIATGIPMAVVLFAHKDVSLIVLPAMLYHQIQLMVCAVLARRYARRTDDVAVAAR